MLKIASKLMVNKGLSCLREVIKLGEYVMKGKENNHTWFMQILKVF